MARFNQNGSLDTTFSGDEKFISNEDPTSQDANNRDNVVAIAPDGKIVAAGDYSFRTNQQEVMILRFLGEGGTVAADAKFDFDGDGETDVAVYRVSAGAWYLNRTTQGFTGVPFGISEDLSAPNAFVR